MRYTNTLVYFTLSPHSMSLYYILINLGEYKLSSWL